MQFSDVQMYIKKIVLMHGIVTDMTYEENSTSVVESGSTKLSIK